MKRVILLFIAVLTVNLAVAGDLNPPAAPGSTMKTLGEVEPRIPLGQADFPAYINQRGSYYLTEDVVMTTDNHGINIDADDVVIDLCGYSITGTNNVNYNGVYMTEQKNVTIKNGTIQSFGASGVRDSYSAAFGHRIINLTIKNCGQNGIYFYGSGHLIQGCNITNNGTGRSNVRVIYTASGSKIIDNLIDSNCKDSTGDNVYAICTGNSSQIVGNIISYNGRSSTAGYACAIYAKYGSIVKDNTLYHNFDEATSTTVHVIDLYAGCLCKDNALSYNGTNAAVDTISILKGSHGCSFIGNTMSFNGYQSTFVLNAYPIHASYSCTLDGNSLFSNPGSNSLSSSCVVGTNSGF